MKTTVSLIASVLLVLLPLAAAQPCPLAICFAIDTSSSISEPQFELQLDAAEDLLVALPGQFAGTSLSTLSFSATSYSSTSRPISPLTTNLAAFRTALDQTPYPAGFTTASGLALQQCDTYLSSAPAGAVRLTLILSDGIDTDTPFGTDVAPGLKNGGMLIAGAVSGGAGGDLRQIVSSRSLFIPSVDQLNTPAVYDALVSAAANSCGSIATPTPVSTPAPTPTSTPISSRNPGTGQTCPLAICFAIDTSSSISEPQFDLQLDAAEDLLVALPGQFAGTSLSTVSFSATSYSSTSRPISPLTTNLAVFRALLDQTPYPAGFTTASGLALQQCDTYLSSAPTGAVRLTLILSDGIDTDTPFGTDVAPGLKNGGMLIAGAVSGGAGGDLRQIVSSRSLFIPSVDQLNTPAVYNALVSAADTACGSVTPPTPTATPTRTPVSTPTSTATAAAPSSDPTVTPTSTPSPIPAGNCPLTLCLAIDTSSSISRKQFRREIAAANNLIASLPGALSGTPVTGLRFSATAFSASLRPISPLTTDRTAFSAALSAVTYPSGFRTASGLGLRQCETYLNNGPSNAVPFIILLSDGFDTATPRGRAVAPGVKSRGAVIATVNVAGSGGDLPGIATNERLVVDSIADLNTQATIQEIVLAAGNVCTGASYTPTPSATPSTTSSATPTPAISQSSSPIPSTTNTATATPSSTKTAAPSSTSTATASNIPSATPSSTNSAIPSTTRTAAPSTTSTATAIPSTTSTAAPSTTSTAAPSTTSTAAPSTTRTAAPIPTPSSSPAPACAQLRVCFAIDESSSIKSGKFAIQTRAISSFAAALSSLSRSTVFSASTFTGVAQTLTTPVSLSSFQRALASNRQAGGATSSGAGMLRCASILDTAGGAGQKVIVLVTDGQDNVSPLGTNVAPSLKDGGFVISAIGIGGSFSKRDLKGIASTRKMYRRFGTFDKFARKIQPFARRFCDISGPVAPSPSPRPSSSPRPLRNPRITSAPQVPGFGRGKSDLDNVAALRAAFEFRLAKKLGLRTRMRVSSCIESSAHPNFPWNVLGGDGRFYWPGKAPSPTPVILSDRMVQDVTIEVSTRSLKKCPARSCAAYIRIEANRRIDYGEVRAALRAIKKTPAFALVFKSGQDEKTRIVRTSPNSFAVFVAFREDMRRARLG